MLCDAFCSHTALPRAKGVHQPRDSAVFPLKTNNHSSSSKQYNHSASVTHTRAAIPERTHARGIAPREKRACVGHGRTHDQQGTGPGNGPRRPEDPGHETQDPRPKGKRQKTSVYVCGVGSTAFKHTVGPKSIAAPECPGTGTAPIAPCAPTHQKSTKRNRRA